jgi:hypothetical protein
LNNHAIRGLLVAFWPLTALVLFCDSRALAGAGWDSQWVPNLLAPLFLLILSSRLPPDRRLLACLFVPITALGEGLFSLVFGLYHYRLGGVPIYVPFGHAVLLSIGLILADSAWVVQHTRLVRHMLIAFHGGLIGGAWLLLGDSLSALFGGLFGLLLWRSGGRLLYLIMGLLVLYIELLGTAWGCWRWDLAPWGVLHTLNPPVGAFACYVVADIIGLRLARRLTRWRAQRIATLPAPLPVRET